MTLSRTLRRSSSVRRSFRSRILSVFLLLCATRSSLALEPAQQPSRKEIIRLEWQVVAREKGVPGRVTSTAIDSKTLDVWLGTWGGGLVRYSGGRFDVFDQFNSGLSGDLVFSVVAAQGRVFAATNGGISSYNPARNEWGLYLARRASQPHSFATQLDILGGKVVAHGPETGSLFYDATADRWIDADLSPPSSRVASYELPTCAEGNSDISAATGLDTMPQRVAIAVYGPRNRTMVLPGSPPQQANDPDRIDVAAVEHAIEEINREGGFRGSVNVELNMIAPGYARYGWTLPEDDVVHFAQQSHVAGIVGFLSDTQPVLNEVVRRTDVPWLTVASPVTSIKVEQNPWVYRCWGDYPRRCRTLLESCAGDRSRSRIAIVRMTETPLSPQLDWFEDHARRRGLTIVADVQWPNTVAEQRQQLHQLVSAEPELILTWSNLTFTASFLRAWREQNDTTRVVVSPDVVVSGLAALVGLEPGDVITLAPSTGGDEIATGDTAPAGEASYSNAAQAHNAARHLARAVDLAGLDRDRIRCALEHLSKSIHGESHFEFTHPPKPVAFMQWRGGKWIRSYAPSG